MDDLGRLDSGVRHELTARPLVNVQATKRIHAEAFAFNRELTAMLPLIRRGIMRNGIAVLHVSAATPGEGVSTAAREIVHAAAALSWCRVRSLQRLHHRRY